jgi:FlaG/FlaF family flagellin (archaellin)
VLPLRPSLQAGRDDPQQVLRQSQPQALLSPQLLEGYSVLNQKGISPEIATVLIAAVVIALAIVVAYWMSGLVTIFTQVHPHPVYATNMTIFYVSILPNSSSPYWLNITSGQGNSIHYTYIHILNGPYNAEIDDAWMSVSVYSLDNKTALQVWILDVSKIIAYSGICTRFNFTNWMWKG